MRTRSLTVIQELSGREICGLYRNNNGGLTEHGAELKAFLDGFRVVNGVGVVSREKVAFGMGCLTAQVIAHFTRELGSAPLNTGQGRKPTPFRLARHQTRSHADNL
ncbi:MAG: hypothetical protein IPM59_03615 [Chloracidobacterium sp.]|nr:hypothetical protein [Chloracidobacterium sp.]